MSDSLQKIIDDMKYDSDPGNEVDPFVALKEYIERLEAMQKQPVAWMSEMTGNVKPAPRHGIDAVIFTVPLIRAD